MAKEEADIQRDCLEWLKWHGYTAWRCSLAGVKFQGFRAKNPMRGHPDVAGVFEGGRYFVIEVKTPAGRLSPEQKVWRDLLVSKGCVYMLARSVEDLEREFRDRHPTLTKDEQQDALESLNDFTSGMADYV
jgi:hypothetical protein